MRTDRYYTEGAAVVTSDGWVDAGSLASMELPNDTNNFYIKSYGDTSGQSEWADLTVSIGNKASTYSFTDQSFDAGTEVTYDQVLDTTNLDADAWLKIYNAEGWNYGTAQLNIC